MTPINQNATFGFITVIEVKDLGHCGGLLTLNVLGRPIEFHCTAPVVENRAQRILYGQTYFSYLYCDQIGLALVAKAKKRPAILITNQPQMLPLTDLVPESLLLMSDDNPQLDPRSSTQRIKKFNVHDDTIWTQNLDEAAFSAAQQLCIEFTESIPLDEPFERIQQAIEEAQSVVR